MTKQPEKRVIVNFDQDMLDEVEKFRYVRRIGNRSEAIRELIRVGLDNSDLTIKDE